MNNVIDVIVDNDCRNVVNRVPKMVVIYSRTPLIMFVCLLRRWSQSNKGCAKTQMLFFIWFIKTFALSIIVRFNRQNFLTCCYILITYIDHIYIYFIENKYILFALEARYSIPYHSLYWLCYTHKFIASICLFYRKWINMYILLGNINFT